MQVETIQLQCSELAMFTCNRQKVYGIILEDHPEAMTQRIRGQLYQWIDLIVVCDMYLDSKLTTSSLRHQYALIEV